MHREPDQHLLQAYARTGDEDAFAALVSRYTDLVYSSALRQLRDRHLAEDATQTVFVILSRKAKSLPADCILSGWLLKAVRFIVADTIRAESRRRQRETRAAEMAKTTASPTPSDSPEIEPVIDQALAQLSSRYRSAILLRFFEQQDYPEIAERLEISEPAARQRISRGLDRLRSLLQCQGATVTGTALSTWLAEHSVNASPTGLADASIAAAKTASHLPFLQGAALAIAAAQTKFIAAGVLLLLALGAVAVVVTLEKPRIAAGPALMLMADDGAPQPPAGQQLTGIVQTPDGRPVADAKVLLTSKNNHIVVYGDHLPDHIPSMQSNGLLTTVGAYNVANALRATTGADGRFTILATSPNPHIVVRGKEGFAQLTASELARRKSITVQPWASIQGTFELDGRPAPRETIQLFRVVWPGDATNIAVIHLAETTTDAQGNFVFPQVAPGPAYIARYVRPWTTLYTHWQYLDVQPAQQIQIQLGGRGAGIQGTLATPKDWPETVLWKGNGRTEACFAYLWDQRGLPAHREVGKAREPEHVAPGPFIHVGPSPVGVEPAHGDVDTYRRYALPRWVPIDPDGSFAVPDLPPGSYRLSIHYFRSDDADWSIMDTLLELDQDLVITPTDASKGSKIDLGPLMLRATPYVHVGEDALEIQGKTLDGKQWKLSDQRGKYVLLAFEGSFWNPELNSLAQLKQAAQTWKDDELFTIASICIDPGEQTARRIVEKNQLTWPHIYMGLKPNAYNVTYPKTFLIDPKGHVIARGMVGKNIIKAIQAVLPRP